MGQDLAKIISEEAVRLKKDYNLNLYQAISKAKEIYKNQLEEEKGATA
ncbi:MAG: hypothetical protein ACRDD7_17120 [Peptostreptococcaceae bacterium]